jgi:hypothetical protein
LVKKPVWKKIEDMTLEEINTEIRRLHLQAKYIRLRMAEIVTYYGKKLNQTMKDLPEKKAN